MTSIFSAAQGKYLFIGCLLTVLAPAAIAAADEPARGGFYRALMANKLEGAGNVDGVAVTDLRARKQDDLLRVQAEVSNTGSGNQQLFYRFKWLDRDGFAVWDDEPWKPMIVYGKQKQVISVTSPTFKATDFRLVLQGAAGAVN